MKSIAQTMLQSRASLRKVEESLEALVPLARGRDMADILRAIIDYASKADEMCKGVYNSIAAEAFGTDAKENTA